MTRGCHISIHDLTVTFRESPGQETISRLDCEIEAGQFLGLIGPSGCGKSTLLRCIAGLQPAHAGAIQQQLPDQAEMVAPKLAYVFQSPTLLPWRSVIENIALPLELAGIRRTERQAAAAAAMRTTGLRREHDEAKLPRMLSGGMQMRVSLARAIVTQPDLMLLDEPFAALDDISRKQLNTELMELWRTAGWTGVFVTHNVAEAVFLCQRIVVMSRNPGRIAADIAIPLPYPRASETRLDPEYMRLVSQVADALEQTMRE